MNVWESKFFRTTTTYINLGEHCVLIDPNLTEEELFGIQKFVHSRHKPEKVFLFFTHSDYDHIAGFPFFIESTIVASTFFKSHHLQRKAISELREFDASKKIYRSHPYCFPRIDHYIEKNRQIFKIGDFEIVFFFTPGHTRDSLMIVIPALHSIVAGDYLSNIEIPVIDHDLDLYRTTLDSFEETITEFNINYLVSGHGDYSSNRQEMWKRIQLSREYLAELEACTVEHNKFELEKWIKLYPPRKSFVDFHNQNLLYLKNRKT